MRAENKKHIEKITKVESFDNIKVIAPDVYASFFVQNCQFNFWLSTVHNQLYYNYDNGYSYLLYVPDAKQ